MRSKIQSVLYLEKSGFLMHNPHSGGDVHIRLGIMS